MTEHVHEWVYDDRGNHWCLNCRLWHDFPHNSAPIEGEPEQDPNDCKEDDE